MARPWRPSAARSTPGPSAPLTAAASAEASPGATSQPFRPVSTLSGRPPAVGRDDRAAMRHGLERDQRAALVERGVHEQVRRLVPRVQRRVIQPPGDERAIGDAGRGDGVLQPAPVRTVADHDPAPAPAGNHRRVIAQRPERGGEDVEALVRLQASDAQQHDLVVGDARRPADAHGHRRRVACRSSHRRSMAFGIDDDAVGRESEVCADRRLQGAVGGDDPIGGPGARDHGPPQRQVGDPLEARAPRIRRAELLESLRVQHQRRRGVPALPRVPEHAGAEPVDDVDLAAVDEVERRRGRRARRRADTRCCDRAPSFRGGRRAETSDTAPCRGAPAGGWRPAPEAGSVAAVTARA